MEVVEVVEVNGYAIEPGADLFGANLTDADFAGAYDSRVYLSGTEANEDTIWPQGFDPVAAGVSFED